MLRINRDMCAGCFLRGVSANKAIEEEEQRELEVAQAQIEEDMQREREAQLQAWLLSLSPLLQASSHQ